MPVKLNSTGGGSVTLTTPSTASDFTVTIPAATGTMVTTTSASTIEFAAGSAAAPSVTTTGDTNTGIFFPAADTIAFSEGGAEVMRIDSSGNVGIGTTSTTANAKLAVEQGIVARASTAGLAPYLQLYNSNAGTDLKTWRIGGDSAGSLLIETVNDAYSAATQRLVINSSGNFLFNSGYGSVATAYGCRAWVNFNGDGTIAIRGSAGVTSLTDNGTGQYTINLSFTMPDSNYAVVGSAGSTNNAIGDRQLSTYPVNTTSCKVVSGQTASSNVYDATQVHVAIFR
jgi:hypothetical protein